MLTRFTTLTLLIVTADGEHLPDRVLNFSYVGFLQISLSELEYDFTFHGAGRIHSVARVAGNHRKRYLRFVHIYIDLCRINFVAHLEVFRHCLHHGGAKSRRGMKAFILKFCRAQSQRLPGNAQDSTLLHRQQSAWLHDGNTTGIRSHLDQLVLSAELFLQSDRRLRTRD